jgi:hypothetical protein
MNGKELFNQYASKRDYSGNNADEYAQFLFTLFIHLGESIYLLLERAQAENKKLGLNPELTNSDVLFDEYTISDIIFI